MAWQLHVESAYASCDEIIDVLMMCLDRIAEKDTQIAALKAAAQQQDAEMIGWTDDEVKQIMLSWYAYRSGVNLLHYSELNGTPYKEEIDNWLEDYKNRQNQQK